MSALVPNRHILVDASVGDVAMTLPTGAAPGDVASVEKIDASAHLVPVTGSIRGVLATTLTLKLQHQAVGFKADADGSWWPIWGHLPLSSLDGVYVARPASGTAEGDVPTVQPDGSVAYAPPPGGVTGSAVDVGGFTELTIAGGATEELSKRFNEGHHDFQYLPKTGASRTARGDGAAPTVLDSGHTFQQLATDSRWAGFQAGGFLDHDFSSAGGAAALYAAVPALPDKVRGMAAEIVYDGNVVTTSEALGLIAFASTIAPGAAPFSNSHVVFGPSSWTWGFYEAGFGQDIQQTWNYNTPVAPGKLYTVRWWIDFERECAYAVGPDGVPVGPITDKGRKWVASQALPSSCIGMLLYNNGNTYRLAAAGTTASGGGGPAGTGAGIGDGTCVWDYVQAGIKSRFTDSVYLGFSPTYEAFAAVASATKVRCRRIAFDTGVTAKGRRESDARHPSYLDLFEAVTRRRLGSSGASRLNGSTARWAQSTAYTPGATVSANGNLYLCTTGGTSAATGFGPSGIGASIADGTVTWAYQAGASHPAWLPSTAYTVGQYVTNVGYVFRCVVAGTSASSGGPATTGLGSFPAADGTVRWVNVGGVGTAIGLSGTVIMVARTSFIVPVSRRACVRGRFYVEVPTAPQWQPGVTYAFGDYVTNGKYVYQCGTAGGGASAASGAGPTGSVFGNSSTDNAIAWTNIGAPPALYVQCGVSGVTSYGPGSELLDGRLTRSGAQAVEHILDLSPLQPGLQFDATIHLFLGSNNAVALSTADTTTAKRPTVVVDALDPIS